VNARELIVLLAMCTVWGFHFIVIKLAVAEIPPIFYAAIRMTLVAVIMAAFLRWRAGQMHRVFIAGLGLGAFNYAFMFTGLKYATASASAVAIELYVPFATILSVIFLGESVGWRRVFGIALAFIGVAIIALGSESDEPGAKIGLGVGLVACGAMSEAIAAINLKRAEGFKPHELLAWFSLIGSLALWPLTFIFENGHGAAWAASDKGLVAAAIFYSAIGGSIVAHTAFYWLLQRLPVSQVAVTTLITTVIAVFAGVLILDDPFGPPMIFGGLITLIGVAVVITRTPGSKVIEPDAADTLQ